MKFVTFSHKVEYIYTYHPNFSLSSDDLIHLAFEQIEPGPNLVSKRVSHDKTHAYVNHFLISSFEPMWRTVNYDLSWANLRLEYKSEQIH